MSFCGVGSKTSFLSLSQTENLAPYAPLLHSFTKTPVFFLKEPTEAPLTEATGRRYQTKEWAPDLFHDETTLNVEGEVAWLSVSTRT
tara:strand:- start:85 stop:345 length:261 start_codon:yes stop_codon:yes gene_type:complete